MYALLIVVLLEGGESVVQADPLLHSTYNSCISTAAHAMNVVVSVIPDTTDYVVRYKCIDILKEL